MKVLAEFQSGEGWNGAGLHYHAFGDGFLGVGMVVVNRATAGGLSKDSNTGWITAKIGDVLVGTFYCEALI